MFHLNPVFWQHSQQPCIPFHSMKVCDKLLKAVEPRTRTVAVTGATTQQQQQQLPWTALRLLLHLPLYDRGLRYDGTSDISAVGYVEEDLARLYLDAWKLTACMSGAVYDGFLKPSKPRKEGESESASTKDKKKRNKHKEVAVDDFQRDLLARVAPDSAMQVCEAFQSLIMVRESFFHSLVVLFVYTKPTFL